MSNNTLPPGLVLPNIGQQAMSKKKQQRMIYEMRVWELYQKLVQMDFVTEHPDEPDDLLTVTRQYVTAYEQWLEERSKQF